MNNTLTIRQKAILPFILLVCTLSSCVKSTLIDKNPNPFLRTESGKNTLAFRVDSVAFERYNKPPALFIGSYESQIIATYNESQDTLQIRCLFKRNDNNKLEYFFNRFFLAIPVYDLMEKQSINVNTNDVRLGYTLIIKQGNPSVVSNSHDSVISNCLIKVRLYDKKANIVACDFQIDGIINHFDKNETLTRPIPFHTTDGQFDIKINSAMISYYWNGWYSFFYSDLQDIVMPEKYSDYPNEPVPQK